MVRSPSFSNGVTRSVAVSAGADGAGIEDVGMEAVEELAA
jgi:hypothetical protein